MSRFLAKERLAFPGWCPFPLNVLTSHCLRVKIVSLSHYWLALFPAHQTCPKKPGLWGAEHSP